MIDNLYYSSRGGVCENSFVDYKMNYEKLCYSLRKIWKDPLAEFNYQKLCYLMRQITKDLNSATVSTHFDVRYF